MCGIAGIVDLKDARDIERERLRRMTDALAHRGPDGEGFFVAPGVGFGHRRLAIIDPQGGAQPFHSQSGQGVLSFNGEIYNFRELAAQLAATGVSLKTQSDTEVLTEHWARNGAGAIHDLRGMFAFSYWDRDTRELTLARDRLGERPLYYAITKDGFFIFASEIGALLQSGMIDAEIGPEALADYFFYGFVPDPKSIYRNIHKLPPAHILTVQPGGAPRLARYWRPVFVEGANLSFERAADLLLDKIDASVSAQMISDAPLGAFLSGGVDSAGVVAAMAQTGKTPITCTIGFAEDDNDERASARAIAEKFHSDHFEAQDDFAEPGLVDRLALAFGEPFADSAALTSYITAKLARQRVKVALTGDGGDEIFAGYRRYPFFLREERVRRLAPNALRQLFFGPLGALYPKLDWARRPLRLKSTLQGLAQPSSAAYAASLAINPPNFARSVLSGDLIAQLKDYRPAALVDDLIDDARTDDALSRAQYVDLMSWLPGRMLVKNDRAAMAHGLELRPPLLDHQLVEWAGLLPASFKLKDGARKRILKEALAARLDAQTLMRAKQGFEPPLASLINDDEGGPLSQFLDSQAWRDSGLIDEGRVINTLRQHRSGRCNHGQSIWSLIMFDAFLRIAKAQCSS